MDLPWGDEKSNKFVTNVGLITSDGPYGPNVMAAEWTHHISYSPGLIAININRPDATHANIVKSKEFGVNLCSSEQSIASSIAGGNSGKEVDKIKVLRELGIEFYKAKRINALMIKGAAMNAECKLIKAIELGDRTMFVGEVVEASATEKQPLAYHDGKYWNIGERIQKPDQGMMDKIRKLAEKYRKR